MLIIFNKELASEASCKLQQYGEILPFETEGISYKGVSSHPDIFIFVSGNNIILAPNIPANYAELLLDKGCKFIYGEKEVGGAYPHTSFYNAVANNSYLIHNLHYTDNVIKKTLSNLKHIHVNQGYCRCNLIALPNNTYITSDKGIENALLTEGLEVLFVNPEKIVLNGFKHGFFGGCCGISTDYFFINGTLKYFKEKSLIEKFIQNSGLQLIELTNEVPVDVGSIIIFSAC